jgi:hypothetical protein
MKVKSLEVGEYNRVEGTFYAFLRGRVSANQVRGCIRSSVMQASEILQVVRTIEGWPSLDDAQRQKLPELNDIVASAVKVQ